jgi:hypothetical protein
MPSYELTETAFGRELILLNGRHGERKGIAGAEPKARNLTAGANGRPVLTS